jgi:hypothetical protein
LLWIPYFLNFVPQQNEVLWVPEHLRTHFKDFFTIYGLFALVLAFAFIPVCSKAISKWTINSTRWNGLDDLIDDVFSFLVKFSNAESPVLGLMFLGLVFLAAIYISSWVHWTGIDSNRWIVQLLATFTFISFFGAVYFKRKIEFWIVGGSLIVIWAFLMILKILPLNEETNLPLGFGLFSELWLSGFYYLGLSVKSRGDRAISFSYVLTAMFLLIVAALEVFAMHEYLGGDYMRNNSLFKFGINAWTLASISAGVFAPQVYLTIKAALKNATKESSSVRFVLFTL